MSGRTWRLSERILLLAVVLFAVLAVFRLVTREPAPVAVEPPPPGQETDQKLARTDTPHTDQTPPSPACAEVLERIRSCSPKDLEGIVDRMVGTEALVLYRQLTSADRQKVFTALPAPILSRKAKELLGVPESCFRNAGRPGILASSLVDAAMGTSGIPADPDRRGLSFATAVDAQGAPQGPRGIFRSDERKIYACMDSSPEPIGESGVLVRWIEEGSGSLVYLHYLPLALNRRWNYVFFEVAATWRPGTYRVNVFRIGRVASLLAEGTYVVE